MFNLTGVGKVIKEVTIKEVGDTKVGMFTMVSNRSFKKGDDWETNPTFVDVKAWGGLADAVERLKGKDWVMVTGRVEQEWWGEGDARRSKYVLTATHIQKINPGKAEEQSTETETKSEAVPF